MLHDDDTPTNTPDLSTLTDALEDALNTPMAAEDALQRQTHILDQLFHAVIHDTLRRARGYSAIPLSDRVEELSLALRIQKQCAETHRIAAAMDYMGAITPTARRALPAAPENELIEIPDKSNT